MRGKKGFNLLKYPIGLLLFSFIVYGWFSVASQSEGVGFWKNYGYTAPTNNISSFNKISTMSEKAETLACDINPEDCDLDTQSGETITLADRIYNFGFRGILTLYKLYSVPKELIISSLSTIGVPTIVTEVAYILLLLAVVVTVIFIIVNRTFDV